MPHASATQASETIFLVLRRMRTPLIVLIVIFAVSVLGLTLIPGQDAPFDAFGDHLRLALRAPASYQLLTWLQSGPGAELPARGQPPRAGRWVVCGDGRFVRELTRDLPAEGLDVAVVMPAAAAAGTPDRDNPAPTGDGYEPDVAAQADLRHAAGFVAGTDNDTTNLSLVAAARRANPDLFVAARQNRPASAPLFAMMAIDALLVPPRSSPTRCTRSSAPRCCGASCARCRLGATSGRPA